VSPHIPLAGPALTCHVRFWQADRLPERRRSYRFRGLSEPLRNRGQISCRWWRVWRVGHHGFVAPDEVLLPSSQESQSWALTYAESVGLYLVLLGAWLVYALLRSRGVKRRSAASYVPNSPVDVYEAAYLAGGSARVVLAATYAVLAADRVRSDRAGRLLAVPGPRTGGIDDVVCDMVTAYPGIHIRAVVNAVWAVHPSITAIEESLRAKGLLISQDQERSYGRTLIPVLAVLAVGVALLANGARLHRPQTILVILLLVTVILGSVAWAALPLLSDRGDEKLTALKAAYEESVATNSGGGAPTVLGVALIGAEALRDPVMLDMLLGPPIGPAPGGYARGSDYGDFSGWGDGGW
jgi:uncharacterized protein (TIGR04222 family)